MLCRKRKKDFTRNRNMNFYSIIYYFIFRNRTTTNADLTHFYSSIDKFERRISKQALNKAIKKLNPNVFTYLINQFASIYYASSLPKKYHAHADSYRIGNHLYCKHYMGFPCMFHLLR